MTADLETHLPQGCSIEEEFGPELWAQFLECARQGFRSGELLDNEFYLKIERHGVSEKEVARALRQTALVAAYVDDGAQRVALWDGRETGLLVLARVSNGRIFNAYAIEDFDQMLEERQHVRWLHR